MTLHPRFSAVCLALFSVLGFVAALAAQDQPKIQAIKPKEVTQKVGKLTMQDVPLIPRKAFFGNPEKARPRLSHDGKQLAYVAPLDGVLNVFVGPADRPAAAKPVTHDQHRGVTAYSWAYTNQHIGYTQDKNGDEDNHVYSI